jgi:hypothetical protein
MHCEPWTNHSITEEQPARFSGTDAQMPICRNYQMGNRNLSPSNKQTAPPMRAHCTSNKKYPQVVAAYRIIGCGEATCSSFQPEALFTALYWQTRRLEICASKLNPTEGCILLTPATWATCLIYHMTYLLGRSKHNPLMVC